jgi:hypothetical protein
VFYLDATAAETMAVLTADLREHGCELLLARIQTPVLATMRANPYRQGATRELRAFPSVHQAHAYAQEELELRRGGGGKEARQPET